MKNKSFLFAAAILLFITNPALHAGKNDPKKNNDPRYKQKNPTPGEIKKAQEEQERKDQEEREKVREERRKEREARRKIEEQKAEEREKERAERRRNLELEAQKAIQNRRSKEADASDQEDTSSEDENTEAVESEGNTSESEKATSEDENTATDTEKQTVESSEQGKNASEQEKATGKVKKQQKSKKPVVQKQFSTAYVAYRHTRYCNDRVAMAIDDLQEEITAEWTDQYKRSADLGITDLIKAMSNEDRQHDLNTLRGIQDSLDKNQPCIEKLQKIIRLIAKPKVRTQEGEDLTLLRMDDDKLANVDIALLANMEQQLTFFQFVTKLVCARLASCHETRKIIRDLKFAKGELAELPDNDYTNPEVTFNEMRALTEQE